MDTTYSKPDTLIGALLSPLDFARAAGLVVGFSLLTALAAQIVDPNWRGPNYRQHVRGLAVGALLGRKLGAMAMVAYLIEGTAGLPFFTGGTSGITHLLGQPADTSWPFPRPLTSPASLLRMVGTKTSSAQLLQWQLVR